jgi:hypothetical protein
MVVVRKSILVAGLVVVAMLSGSVVALAASQFSDVPDSNVFQADITWLAAHEVTKGCNPPANDRFCPNDSVTRGQMAAFLHRFGEIEVEHTIAIDQIGFLPITTEGSYIDYDYYGAGTTGRGSPQRLGASLPVPDGATVTGFAATFCDSTSVEDFTAQLIRRPDPANSGAAPEVMAEVTTTGATDCAITVTTGSISNPVVDTGNYSYAVEIRTADGSGTVTIRRATVTYQEPLIP